jgi:hypothetical protein
MDSKPEYDEWYAPIDPFAVMLIGAVTVIFTGVVVKFARHVRSHPYDAVMFIGAVLPLVCFYLLGLVVYHGYQRFV